MVYINQNSQETRILLEEDPWFTGCREELKDALIAHGSMRKLADGECLFRPNEKSEHALYCVLDGAICVGSIDSQGLPMLLVYLEPYHWFGELPLIDEKPRAHHAIADGSATVICVPHSKIRDWLKSHPESWKDIARLAAAKLRVAYSVLSESGTLTQLVARRLWIVAHGFGTRNASPNLELSLSQEQLAHMLGTSRQSINKALRSLESNGIIKRSYKSIEIHDLEALRLTTRTASDQ